MVEDVVSRIGRVVLEGGNTVVIILEWKDSPALAPGDHLVVL